MRNLLRFTAFLLITWAPIATAAPHVASWQSPYTGEEAQGPSVIAFWNFEETGDKVIDASGKGHDGTLAGAQRNPEGRFGAGMTSFRGYPVEDVRHAVHIPNTPALSPAGAFTLELWVRPSTELADYGMAYLMDKKYVAHTDYQWVLDPPDGQGHRRMRLTLGFGDDSDIWWSTDSAPFDPGVWYHLAVTYDGAGTTEFLQNGRSLGGATKAGRGRIAPGTQLISLGDRVGSNYSGFPGDFDEIRITNGLCEFRPITIEATHRRSVYQRMESGASLTFQLRNVRLVDLAEVTATIQVPGMAPETVSLPTLAAGGTFDLSLALDTRLRADIYDVAVSYTLGTGEDAYSNREHFPVRIMPRKLPHQMPVVMWGVGGVDEVTKNTPALKDIGFTHCLGLRTDYDAIWEAGAPVPAVTEATLEESYKMLDQALADDLGIVITLGNGHWMDKKEELRRVDADGTPYARVNPCCLTPGVLDFSKNVGASVAQSYGDFPAFAAALINTEVRDSSQVCFHEHDRAAYRAASGREYPESVEIKNGVSWTKIPDFPANRVVPDDHELLQFYRWFWRDGDGWNPVHSAVNEGLKSTGRDDFWTFFDPAVRVPSIWGSGGSVDFISHWTYSYPDPIRIGLTTDELFAMAGGNAAQDVMKMTQIIWYRSQTAPVKEATTETPEGVQSAWEDYDPDAAYITIAPMHLKEAFWTKMSRPIKGIMYHGWQSLVPTEGGSAYRYTHPETRNVLKGLVHDVVQPLGPTLLQVPAVTSDVAFLESFTSQIFANRGTYGWGGSWAGDAYHVLQYAQLQAEIVYEETIQQRGLDGFKVLVLTDCDVLPESLVAAILAFQGRGGVVIGDERLCPAITADILLESYERTKASAADKAALMARAATLRNALNERYTPAVTSSNQEVLPYRRRAGTTDYVFAINDTREYGDYVGQYGLVMEKGLPASATFSMARSGHVYDLMNHQEVPVRSVAERMEMDLLLEPGGGALLMVTERPIAGLTLSGGETANPGGALSFTATVMDDTGAPVDGVIPVEVTILDPDGRASEQSGYYGAAGGTLALTLDLAPNDTLGMWTIKIREQASGKTAMHFFRLEGEA